MYGIYAYIYHKNQPSVGKYTSPMDPMGYGNSCNSQTICVSQPRGRGPLFQPGHYSSQDGHGQFFVAWQVGEVVVLCFNFSLVKYILGRLKNIEICLPCQVM